MTQKIANIAHLALTAALAIVGIAAIIGAAYYQAWHGLWIGGMSAFAAYTVMRNRP